MTNPQVGGEQDPLLNSDPLANSLYNLTTLKTLIHLGQNSLNIVGAEKDQVLNKNFNLSNWTDIARTLELNDGDDEAGLLVG